MSYLRADEILPIDLLEAVRQYADGQLLYIPRKEKQSWGSHTSSKAFFRERNEMIYDAYVKGVSTAELACRFSLSQKSVQRIVREMKKHAASQQ